MSEEYQYVVTGKLKLKGIALPTKDKRKKRKKKKRLKEALEVDLERGNITLEEGPQAVEVDRRTAAEKKFDEQRKEKELERIRKEAAKSHRERILEMNEKLESMSEHFDIPKVGPG